MRIHSDKLACFGLLIPSLLLAACVTMRAGSDYFGGTDFSNYRRFAWVDESPLIRSSSNRIEISPLTVRRIREAIERELVANGFEQVTNRENADFAVSFTVGARDEIRVDDYPPYYRGQWGWRPPYYWPNVDVTKYTEGMLAIDMFDNASRQPVWHGWARKRITGADIDDPESTINEAVAAILAGFPPTG